MDPRLVISELICGQREEFVPNEPHESLIIAEQAICEGHNELSEQLCSQLNSIELEIINFRIAQLANDAESAQKCLANALEISRN